MCAGLMMTAMHKTMNGTGGLKGWQWVFIIGECASTLLLLPFANHHNPDGLMGIPIGLFGFVSSFDKACWFSKSNTRFQFTFPDLPDNTKASYLTQQEKQFSIERLPRKKPDTHNIQFKSLIRRLLTSPTM
jgi:ACS family pantothenate transporter-like MFS transporter